MSQWQFYIVPTKILDEVLGGAKSISLKRLEEMGQAISYEQIKSEVDNCPRVTE